MDVDFDLIIEENNLENVIRRNYRSNNTYSIAFLYLTWKGR